MTSRNKFAFLHFEEFSKKSANAYLKHVVKLQFFITSHTLYRQHFANALNTIVKNCSIQRNDERKF